MEEVRAHLAVQGRVDEPHDEWLADHGIDLDDDTQSSVSEITYALSRENDDTIGPQ